MYLCRWRGFWPEFSQDFNQTRIFLVQFVRAGRELSYPCYGPGDQICRLDHISGNSSLAGLVLSGVFARHFFIFFWHLLCSYHFTLSHFIYHATANRPTVIKEKPDLSFGEVGKELGARWRALSDKEKETWKNKPE